MICPACGSEYREGYTHCNDCDVDLVEPPPPEIVPEVHLVKIYATGNAAIIPLVESLLSGAGIEFMTTGQPIQDLFGWGRFGANQSFVVGPVEFYVREEAAQEARTLIDTLPTEIAVEDEPAEGN